MALSNKLRFSFELLDHPYPNMSDAAFEAWGRYSIEVHLLEDNFFEPLHLRVPLFSAQWDLSGMADWFVANLPYLREPLLGNTYGGDELAESIAMRLGRLADRVFPPGTPDDVEIDWYEQWSGYMVRHNLYQATPGAQVPSIIIGCQGGVGQISHVYRPDQPDNQGRDFAFMGSWSYPFDIDDFQNHILAALRNVITQWASTLSNPGAMSRAKEMLTKLEKVKATS